MRRPTRAKLAASLLGLALGVSAGSASADEKEACVAASDRAQTMRDDGKYDAARAALLTCARDVCPAIVRRDCEKWLGELDTAQPTLVLGARDPKGNDYPGVRVLLDGRPFIEHLDGKPVSVNPGEHVLRYEATGTAPVEQRVVVRVGEKNRALTAILMPVEARAPSAPAAPSPAAPAPTTESPLARVPLATWVFGGVAVVAAGSFAAFGLSGQGDVNNLRATCAPDCTQGQVGGARAQLAAADVSLGVGVVSLAAAAWFFFRRDRGDRSQATVTFDAAPRPGGGFAGITTRF